MRLGRKISEGYAVDHEADRIAAVQDAPERSPEPEPSGWAPAGKDQPARSGSRED